MTDERGERVEPSFLTILYTMATQALIALGEIENPISRRKSVDPRQAAWILKSLEILQEKTRGNLTPEEEQVMEKLLNDFAQKFEALEN